jgi:arylsulfatase A-like enzyme
MYWEFCTNFQWGHAVRFGNWKAVSFAEGQQLQLYDLESDPAETTDVASANPAVVATAAAYAKEAHTDSAVFPVKNCVSS